MNCLEVGSSVVFTIKSLEANQTLEHFFTQMGCDKMSVKIGRMGISTSAQLATKVAAILEAIAFDVGKIIGWLVDIEGFKIKGFRG